MNFDYWACFTVIECSSIQVFRVSTELSLLAQSFVLQSLIIYRKSSITCGSTGLVTDAFLFLKVDREVPVVPNPF